MHKSPIVSDILETSLRRWLSKRWLDTWHSFIEPSPGSTMGFPDVMVLLPGYDNPIPVELKMAKFVRPQSHRIGGVAKDKTNHPDRLTPYFVRPAQIFWHDQFARAGGHSCLLLGVARKDGGYHCYVQADCRREVLRLWRQGWSHLPLVATNDGIDFEAWKTCMAPGHPRPAPEMAADAIKRAAR